MVRGVDRTFHAPASFHAKSMAAVTAIVSSTDKTDRFERICQSIPVVGILLRPAGYNPAVAVELTGRDLVGVVHDDSD
jgi:hypothetical protein